jgi:L-ascorbate metabolism protein UlaG (beta-lactamase superfamily)
MSPCEAAVACGLLRPKQVVPMHFGTFPPLTGRPEQLAALVGDTAETKVWTLDPEKSVKW